MQVFTEKIREIINRDQGTDDFFNDESADKDDADGQDDDNDGINIHVIDRFSYAEAVRERNGGGLMEV
jgi:hypothetical protein